MADTILKAEHLTKTFISGKKTLTAVDAVSFELKQGIGDCVPILSIDLNALNLSTDLQMLQVNQKGIGEIEGIKFKSSPRMLKFQAE